jgi:uncharacterized membrane protein YagU involved in acid resistance
MVSSSTPIRVILLAGLTAGMVDIACTLTLSRLKGIAPKRLLQTITSAALGQRSFEGGSSTAAIGLAIHFFIACIAAAIYFIASRQLHLLISQPVLCGLLYGIAVHLFMTFVVLPLSALRRPFSAKAFATQLVVHMLFVGLPIALVVSRYASLSA